MTWSIPDDAKPVLFKVELVRAILAGRKTVTRRLIIPPPAPVRGGAWRIHGRSSQEPDAIAENDARAAEILAERMPPKWREGTTLYIRERLSFWPGHIRYVADEAQLMSIDDCVWFDRAAAKRDTCPGIHAPKWTSRILLGVKNSRPERLQRITTNDIEAEGIEIPPVDYTVPDDPRVLDAERDAYARRTFSGLWDEINAGRAAWEENPWLYRVEFDLKEVRTSWADKQVRAARERGGA